MAAATAFPSLEAYVTELEGKRALRRVLVANNGIAAVKCIRSIRRWAYDTLGDERAVSCLRSYQAATGSFSAHQCSFAGSLHRYDHPRGPAGKCRVHPYG